MDQMKSEQQLGTLESPLVTCLSSPHIIFSSPSSFLQLFVKPSNVILDTWSWSKIDLRPVLRDVCGASWGRPVVSWNVFQHRSLHFLSECGALVCGETGSKANVRAVI